jgi:putative sigma-54 modulation protein
MNFSITFRHLEATDSIKAYAEEKIAKLQRFLRQPMTVKVTLSLEKHDHVAEVRISAGSEHHEAHEASADMYASIDKVIDKLERQIRTTKGAQESKRRRGGSPVREGEVVDDLGE